MDANPRARYETDTPPRKRQRISSPFHDKAYGISQDRIQTSQRTDSQRKSSSPTKLTQTQSQSAKLKRDLAIAKALEDSRVISQVGQPERTSDLALSVLTPQRAPIVERDDKPELPSSMPAPTPSSSLLLRDDEDDTSWFENHEVPEGAHLFRSAKILDNQQDGDDWFTAPAPVGVSGFQSAKTLPSVAAFGQPELQPVWTSTSALDTAKDAPVENDLPPVSVGFTTGSSLLNPGGGKKTVWMPSAEALARAAETMKKWEKEFEDDFPEETLDEGPIMRDNHPVEEPSSSAAGPSTPLLTRPTLGAPENIFGLREPPDTPSPLGSGFRRPLATVTLPANKQGFKSPLLKLPSSKAAGSAGYVGSPLNPQRTTEAQQHLVSPPRPTLPATPIRRMPISPKRKSLGVTPRRAAGGPLVKKSGFVTPFKAGMKPGEPGHVDPYNSQLQQQPARQPATISVVAEKKNKGKGRPSFFDFSMSKVRLSLASCGLRPQTYTSDALTELGINILELKQITPALALYYAFHTSALTPTDEDFTASPPSAETLGASAAFTYLESIGCDLATKPWVENHWCLILWKLAGTVCLDPVSEADPRKKRWCWAEVLRQLRYRYERELNRASRPPLRLIVAQDVSPGVPMVLAVSGIIWSDDIDHGGTPVQIEVSDGWYRIRVEIDEPIRRAICKGRLAVGRKIGITGARLSANFKEAAEILEISDTEVLKIYGNSSHLAPWHAKMGFQKEPFVSTLGSLTADGGLVALLDLVVVKMYPIAYLERVESDDGHTRQEVRNEKEEGLAVHNWQAERDSISAKLRDDLEGKIRALEGFVDRLQRKAGSTFRPGVDDSPPDSVDDLLDELVDNVEQNIPSNELIKRISPIEAGWLARAVTDKCHKDRESVPEEVATELNSLCPPREVRSFRVVVMRDGRTSKRPGDRIAQVTVWDVLNVYVNESGRAGAFKEGERFMISNLLPTQHKAWMPRGKDSVIYLCTRRDTRWRKLRP